MEYKPDKKKCVFPKMGTKKIFRNKKKKSLSGVERYKRLSKWRNSWFK